MLSYAIRTLFKNKGFTITAVLTLALGIGAWSGASFNVSTDDRPEQVPGSRRTPGFFTFEGLPLLLGRDFLPEEGQPGRDHVVILSHRLWANHFNSNRHLIGKDIRMNGEPYTVVGVLPPGMHNRFNSQLWVPLSYRPEQIAHDSNAGLVMAFAVAQRTHEFGVRMALGAQRSRVMKLVLKEGTILALTGTLIGLGGAYLVGRAMQSTLYGVDALDVRAFTGVSLLLLAAALLACWFPAWRASRVEPLEALRYE